MDEDRKQPRFVCVQSAKAARPSWSKRSCSPCRPARRPTKVLAAVHDFARQEFGGKHRYAMVLHTDEPHPHVHVVVKAVSEDGRAAQHSQGDAAALASGVRAPAPSARGRRRMPRREAFVGKVGRRSWIPFSEPRSGGESSHMAARVGDVVRELKAGSLDQSGCRQATANQNGCRARVAGSA